MFSGAKQHVHTRLCKLHKWGMRFPARNNTCKPGAAIARGRCACFQVQNKICIPGVRHETILAHTALQLHKRGMHVFRREITNAYTVLQLRMRNMQVLTRQCFKCPS